MFSLIITTALDQSCTIHFPQALIQFLQLLDEKSQFLQVKCSHGEASADKQLDFFFFSQSGYGCVFPSTILGLLTVILDVCSSSQNN